MYFLPTHPWRNNDCLQVLIIECIHVNTPPYTLILRYIEKKNLRQAHLQLLNTTWCRLQIVQNLFNKSEHHSATSLYFVSFDNTRDLSQVM